LRVRLTLLVWERCSHDPNDATNFDALETFLTAYDHVPAELPAGFTH